MPDIPTEYHPPGVLYFGTGDLVLQVDSDRLNLDEVDNREIEIALALLRHGINKLNREMRRRSKADR